MATINIRRDVSDRYYRYKMEQLLSKIEGKGNGIKTVIVNLSSVSQSLSRPPAYVIKYFGFELGAQTNTNPADDRWIINGAHEASKLQDYLDGFIAKFVLCKKCKNPETDIHIKDSQIVLDCKACGQRSDVDLRLKLSSFILKNQPKKGKKNKAEKKARRAKAKEAGEADQNGHAGSGGSGSENAEDEENGLGPDAGSDDEMTRRIAAEAKEVENPGEIKDDEWNVDVSAEAVRARANDLKSLQILDDEEDGEGEGGGSSAYDQLGSWVIESASGKSLASVDDVEIYKKAKELGIEEKHKTLTVLAQTIFDKDIVTQIPERAGLLKKLINESERHQKALLGGTERLIGNEHPELIPQVPKILLAYFEKDVISEDVLKAWGAKASKKYCSIQTSRQVRKAAEPFLTWLETAESSSEEEEGEDDE